MFNCWDNLNGIFDQTAVSKINRILQSDSLQQPMSLSFVKRGVNRRQATYAGDKYTESHLQLVRLRPVYTYSLRQIYIVCMVMVRMGSVPILSIKQSVSIDTFL